LGNILPRLQLNYLEGLRFLTFAFLFNLDFEVLAILNLKLLLVIPQVGSQWICVSFFSILFFLVFECCRTYLGSLGISHCNIILLLLFIFSIESSLGILIHRIEGLLNIRVHAQVHQVLFKVLVGDSKVIHDIQGFLDRVLALLDVH
jgi:hypothetical protein